MADTPMFGASTLLAAIPQIPAGIGNLAGPLNAIKQAVEVWQGARGDGLDRVVTVRDLLNSSVLDVPAAHQLYTFNNVPIPATLPANAAQDPATPPTPTNLSADGAIGTIVLSWEFPIAYTRLAYFEVWRSATNALGDATLIAKPQGSVYPDQVGMAAAFYYWVRAVSDAGTSPYNAVDGVYGTTPPAFEDIGAGTNNGVDFPAGTYLADAYIKNGAITNARIGNLAVDTAKIADLAVGTAKIADAAITTAKIVDAAINEAKIQDAAITTAKIGDLQVSSAKIADLAVTDAKISSLDAGKISTGTLDANRIGAGTITADKMSVTSLDAISANLGVITAGVLHNASDSFHMDLDAAGSAVLLRAGGTQDYGPYVAQITGTSTHYKVEVHADGSAFFGRDVISGGAVKAYGGAYVIPIADRPAVYWHTTSTGYDTTGAGP